MFLRSFNFTLKNGFLQHQYQKQEKMFVLRQYFFGVMRNKLHWTTASETSNTKYLELIKRRSKVQEKNMSYELALNFDQWKTFSENYKPIRVWLWLVYKIYRELLSLATFLRVHSNSKEVSYLCWQNTYRNLKTTCHIKLKYFLWTKLLENSLFAKYLI